MIARLALLLCSALAGCAEPGIVYPRPLTEVREELARVGLPPMVFGTMTPPFKLESGPEQVLWIIVRDGADVMHLTATLAAVDAGSTRVAFAVSGPTEGRFAQVNARLAANPAVRNLYLAALEERVDSALENRPFDLSGIVPQLGLAIAANMDDIAADLDRAVESSRARNRRNIERAYEQEGRRRGH